VIRPVWFVGCFAIVSAAPAYAQLDQARSTAESVISVRVVADGEGHVTPATFVDASGAVALRGFTLVVRPVLYRAGGDWTGSLYQALARIDGGSRIGWRIEAGYLAPPLGLASFDSRADVNPTVLTSFAYAAALPSFEVGVPAARLLSSAYPLGAQLSASTAHWDGRVAVTDSSAARARGAFVRDAPARSAEWTIAGGITPVVGLRVGGGWSSGAYAQPSETSDHRRRQASFTNLEFDWSGGYGRVYGEWLRGSFERHGAARDAVARAVTVTAVRTLTPRWFAASRVRATTSPMLTTPSDEPPDEYPEEGDTHEGYDSEPDVGLISDAWPADRAVRQWRAEGTLGFRLTPELTGRAGYIGVGLPGTAAWSHGAGVSLTWARRWW
jgi:hypothetical protein